MADIDNFETVVCAVCESPLASPAWIRSPRDEHGEVLQLEGGRSKWVVCDQCGLVYQSPRPGPEAVKKLYEGGSYHEQRGGQPEHYVAYSLRRSRPALKWAFSQEILKSRKGRALDIGSGIGGALVDLRERGWEVTGIEPDSNLVALGRERFGLDLRTGFLGDSLPGEEFDLAYSCHVWEHLADPLETSRLAHKLLRARDGLLFIVVPTFRQARTLAWSCFSAPHTYMFTHISLGNLLGKAGFEVITHRYAAGSDSELWLLARAIESSDVQHSTQFESKARVQLELALVPMRIPLGIPGRLSAHAKTFLSDPRDFFTRLTRWSLARVKQARRALLG